MVMFCCLPRTPTCLSARACGAGYRLGNPARVAVGDVPALLDGASVAVERILGGRRTREDGIDAVLASGVPAVVLGGERALHCDQVQTCAAHFFVQIRSYRRQTRRLRPPLEAPRSAVILSPFGRSPGHEGFLRARHVAHVRFWAGSDNQKRTEKRRAAGQGRRLTSAT